MLYGYRGRRGEGGGLLSLQKKQTITLALPIVTTRSIEQDAQGLRLCFILNMNPHRGYIVDFHWLSTVRKATKSLRAL